MWLADWKVKGEELLQAVGISLSFIREDGDVPFKVPSTM